MESVWYPRLPKYCGKVSSFLAFGAKRMLLPLPYKPVLDGSFPVKIDEREGPQTDAGLKAIFITIDSCENLSRWSVFTCGFPPKGLAQLFKSSIEINNTL